MCSTPSFNSYCLESSSIPDTYGSTIFPVIKSVLNNSWFCSICCSIIAVYLIYKWQVWYSKRKLKADFRCNEVIEGVYDGIEEFVKFYQEIPKKNNLMAVKRMKITIY